MFDSEVKRLDYICQPKLGSTTTETSLSDEQTRNAKSAKPAEKANESLDKQDEKQNDSMDPREKEYLQIEKTLKELTGLAELI
jgi:hypothetical protein